MSNRENIKKLLKSAFGDIPLYYQPPEGYKIKEYPCVVYRSTHPHVRKADNRVYIYQKCYTVTYLTTDPNDDKTESVLINIPLASYNNTFVSNNIHHTVYTVYA